MTKLIIQIPCLNEEESLPVSLKELPREVEGVDVVEWLIIDDGSSDRTVEVAKELGVDHIVSFPQNQGLAKAFMAGLDRALHEGADIIVNTDADNQYNAADIPALIKPVVEGKADIVVGCRPIQDIEYFSPIKKALQKLGSWVVRVASNTDIPDAPSGFRAFSRDAAMRLNVFNSYTYTLETIIQAGQRGMAITWVPCSVNDFLRPSRLFKSIPAYIKRSILTIVRIFIVYRAMPFFLSLGAITALPGLLLGFRFLFFLVMGEGDGHVQSLILAAMLMMMGFMFGIAGVIADLIGVNRRLLEDIRWRQRRADLYEATGDESLKSVVESTSTRKIS